jgi:hypothetical protein
VDRKVGELVGDRRMQAEKVGEPRWTTGTLTRKGRRGMGKIIIVKKKYIIRYRITVNSVYRRFKRRLQTLWGAHYCMV